MINGITFGGAYYYPVPRKSRFCVYSCLDMLKYHVLDLRIVIKPHIEHPIKGMTCGPDQEFTE